MAKAMGGDMVLQLLHEFREMQEEAKEQYARTDAAILAVNQETDRLSTKVEVLFKHTGVLYAHTQVLYEQVGVLNQQVGVLNQQVGVLNQQVGVLHQQVGVLNQHVGVLHEQIGGIHENMDTLTTRVSSLTREVGGLKSTHSRMLEQVGRTIHHLAEIQASDRQRIDVLEQTVGGAGEH
ncbi:hypothetical protein [Corallococcus carmarthensis]|uniref:hypothetical protein n=1 Tax=Corallococcus carmarthensis TaxID=2316728 RepID=UPI00148CEA66|nr:hypothetical protein [Corallococcus carmarthensis]NOK19652.1 hypothetical protein [Corallococcus carmarthensis]